MLNITAVGNLGKEPEAFQAGTTPGAKLPLAARTGKDETTWLNCVVFGPRSATVLDYFKKGSKVTVIGKASQRFYQKKDGSEGSSIELNVSDFTLPERESKGENASRYSIKEDPYADKRGSNVTPFPKQKSFDNNDIY